MPSDDDIKAAVQHAVDIRGATASAAELDTLLRLAKGRLRLFPLDNLPLDQLAGRLTDLLLLGRRDILETPHRPQIRAQVRSAVTTLGLPAPPEEAVEALVNVTIGWMTDHSLPTPPGGRAFLVRYIVGGYLSGS